jgi:hypothetical protein
VSVEVAVKEVSVSKTPLQVEKVTVQEASVLRRLYSLRELRQKRFQYRNTFVVTSSGR